MYPELASDLLDTSPVLRKQFLQKLKMSEEDIQNGVKQIFNWFETQPFLGAGPLDKKHVENLFIQKEGSDEAVKSSIINYYFLKISTLEMFTGRDPQLPAITDTMKGASFCIQYPLSKSGERYLCVELKKQVAKMDMKYFYKLFFMEFDMKMRFDFTGYITVIVDIRNIQSEHIHQINRTIMAKSMFGLQQAYGIQIKGTHFLVTSDIANQWIKVVESVLDKNAAFALHKDFASLHRSVERELLPKSLGGDQDNVDEVQARWLKEANNWRDWFFEEDRKFS